MSGRNQSGSAAANQVAQQQSQQSQQSQQPQQPQQQPEWVKALTDGGAMTINEALPQINAEVEREFPDFGAGVPEGVYVLTAYCSVHEWKSRQGRVSTIRTRFIRRESDNATFEVALASFVGREWDFITTDGQIAPVAFILPFDPNAASTARRNLRVLELAEGTQVRVNHIRGHWANPLAVRTYNINLTYVSPVVTA
jgi:hypothetical protein